MTSKTTEGQGKGFMEAKVREEYKVNEDMDKSKVDDDSMEFNKDKTKETETSFRVKKKSVEILETCNQTDVNLLISNCVTHIRILYGIILSLVLVIVVGASMLHQELNEIRNPLNYFRQENHPGNTSLLEHFLYSWNRPYPRRSYNSDLHRARRQVSF